MSDTKNLVRVRSGVQSYVEATPDEIGAVALASVGAPNGVAGLDGTGRIPSGQLPSYVDDVLEFANFAAFPAIGESGKIYIAISPGNICYRWGGTVYAEISPSLALGETSATAYRGDRGKTAYDHTLATANAHPIGAITGLDAALAAKLPFVDLTTSPSALDFNATGVTGSYIAACDWSRPAVQAHAPYGPVGYGTLIHIDKGSVISQVFFSAGDYAPSSIAQVYTRTFWSGVWGAWSGLWGAGNLVGTRNEHNHDSVITKSASYDFTGIAASLIKHANGDVIGTLSGGVPGRSYTVVSVASMILDIPSGVTLYGTSGQWAGPSSFTLGGMRPITIQCLSSTEWLIPSYGE